jgi:hypothetical protein
MSIRILHEYYNITWVLQYYMSITILQYLMQYLQYYMSNAHMQELDWCEKVYQRQTD